MKYLRKFHTYFSPTAECYVVFAQYRFRCVLGELGRFLERFQVAMGFRGGGSRFSCVPTGSMIPKMVPGSMGFGQVVGSQGSGTGSGNWFRFSMGEVLRLEHFETRHHLVKGINFKDSWVNS